MFAETYFDKDGETAMKKVGNWVAQRRAIEQNEIFIERDPKAMEDAETVGSDEQAYISSCVQNVFFENDFPYISDLEITERSCPCWDWFARIPLSLSSASRLGL